MKLAGLFKPPLLLMYDFSFLLGRNRVCLLFVFTVLTVMTPFFFGYVGPTVFFGVPAQRLLPALFGFNVGVELGQLAVVALVWPLLRALARQAEGRWYRLLAESGSAAICALGIYWVVMRNWG